MTDKIQTQNTGSRVKNHFILFSAILFSVILIAGSITLVYIHERMSEFDSVMTAFFVIVLIVMLSVFIVFNIFIARYLKSLRKTMDSLEVASNAKSTFLTNMSHEIRTPMNAIIGITDIMMQNDDLPDEMAEGLTKIYGSCDLLLGIINDILDFSKIEAGKLDVTPAQYYVASLINDSVHLNTMRINEKPIEFELIADENVPKKLIGDELRIKQVLNNILSNSFKYTTEGRVTMSVSSEPGPDDDTVILIFSIRDTGQGMSKNHLEKLFDEYTRFGDTGKNSAEGTGLGLAITQRLIYLMDGEIHVESALGIGTYVVIRIPQTKINNDVLGAVVAENLRRFYVNYLTRTKVSRIEYEPMPYGSVLIVDDVETNLYVAVGLMKLYALKIETAMSGYEAIAKVKEGNVYDVIFMDHMMPELNGMETTRELRAMGYTRPIVALTANAVAGQADMFLLNGFDEFISKPIDLRHLNAALIKLIRNKQSPETIAAAHLKINNEASESADHNRKHPDSLLMESFIRDAGRAVAVLDEIINTSDLSEIDDLRKLTVTVHGIKGALASLGDSELYDTARVLEEACRDNDLHAVRNGLPPFYDKLHMLLNKIEPKNDDQNTYEDPENIITLLNEIKNMCSDHNRRGALSTINEIVNCSYKTKTFVNTLKELVLHSEYEEAETVIESYINELKSNQ